MKETYPGIRILEVADITEGLQSVREGRAFGYIDSILTTGYEIQKEGNIDIKISGKLEYFSSPGIATRNDEPLLNSIFQKALDSLSPQQKQSIYNRWVSVRYEHGFDYALLWKILGAVGLIGAVLFIWNWQLRRKVKTGIEKYKQQEAQLIQQSKMAAVGEMIGMIAHQWQQPLTAITLLTEIIKESVKHHNADPNEILTTSLKIQESTRFMADTINDFRNFFKPSKTVNDFKVCDMSRDVYCLIEAKMKNLDVKFTIHEQNCFEIYGPPNEFKQVLLNIYNNACDVFEEKKIKTRKIDIRFEHTNTVGKIIISDTGGGIPEALLPDKLFDPYVSTKGEKGTGIGLQLSKTIIETKFDGKIRAHNVDAGAEFVIEVPMTQQ